jgi:DNA-binding Lrp family transcriptional regulator
MLEKLDSLDRHLISLLQANSRASTANLARHLGVARTTVIARIGRLEKQGIIEGYGVRLGREVEDRSLHAFVGLSVLPRVGKEVLKAVARIPEIDFLCAVSGSYDYIALLRSESATRLDELLDEIGAIEGVRQTNTSIVLATKIDRTRKV